MSLDYPPQVRRPPFRRAFRLPFRSAAGIEGILSQAIGDYNQDGIVGTTSVTAWNNSASIAGALPALNVVVGTGANAKPHPSGAVLLFGASGDRVSSPNSAVTRITGDIDLRSDAAADDWTPASVEVFVSKNNSVGNQRAYFYSIEPSGKLKLNISTNGEIGGVVSYLSSVATGFTNGVRKRTRVTLDADNGSSNSDAIFWITPADPANPDITLADGSIWDQLGDVIQSGSTTSIFASSANVEIGAYGGGVVARFSGAIFQGQIFDGIDGTLVADMNPADQTNTANVTGSTFTSSATGEIWTQNGNSPIQNTGHKALDSIGSYGLETTAGQDIAVFTRFVVGRFTTAAPGADQVIFDARSNALKSVSLFSDFSNSNKLTLDAGGTPIAIAGAYDTDLHVFTVVSNGANSLLRVSGVGEITGNPGGETLDYGTILAALGSGSSAPFSYLRDLTFNTALSGAKQAQIEDALAQKYKGVAV